MSEDRKLIAISSEALSAQIDPLGAQLFTLRDAEGRDLLWDGDPAFWTGRAPILFPIVGSVAHDHYRLGDQSFHMTRHGFARRNLFTIAEQGRGIVRLRLEADVDTFAVYPFHFSLEMEFRITGRRLTLAATIANHGGTPMPASFGFHPALRWPLPYGGERAAHSLVFEKDEPASIRRLDGDGLIKPDAFDTPVEGTTLKLRDELFDDDALVFDQINSRRLRYGAQGSRGLEVVFEDTPYLGVWMKPGADYVCIEPWAGIADPEGFTGDFRDKPGIFEIAPGGERRIAMSIELEP